VPFIVDDEFQVFARERRLPPCALSFLMLAGPWSARESRSGFVPNSMLADFSDDFAQVERTLCSAGILKRVKGGVRIVGGHGVTVVNAKDVTRDAEREEAEVERKRELERTRKQRQRDREKAERAERMSAGVTPMSRGTSTDVTPEKTEIPKKPQVKGDDVPRDIGVTSRVTPQKDASDLNHDQDLYLSGPVEQQPLTARARKAKPGTSEFRLHVIAAFAARTRIEITAETADALAAEVLGRAKGKVPCPLAYVLRAVRQDRDPAGRWLGQAPVAPEPASPPREKRAAPDWCGECDEIDRTVYDQALNRVTHCPNCSAKSFAAWEALAS
jgi:hypothetical protein